MQIADKKFRVPRVWSNDELKKFSHLFTGKVLNVSGWQDSDKQGSFYKNYFPNCDKYLISNYRAEFRGFTGYLANEFFLDISVPVISDQISQFDVVFNHTVLEHIFEVDQAFMNLCSMTRDIVILVVPFMQEQHAEYGDYWRFTPLCIKKLFEKNGLKTIYLNFSDTKDSSVYIFAIASKYPKRWNKISVDIQNKIDHLYDPKYFAGTKIIKNSLFFYIVRLKIKICKYLKSLYTKVK